MTEQDSVPNKPFVFGFVVDGDKFTDRESEQAELRSAFVHGQNVILISPRRYGKTSLVKLVLKQLPSKTHAAVFVDLFKVSSKQRLLNIYSKALSASLSNRFEEILQLIKEWIPALTPKIVFTADQAPEMGIEFNERQTNMDELIDKLWALPEYIAKKKKKHIVVVFDEFQDILALEDPSLLKRLRAVIQHQKHVSYCFMGSKRHMIEDIFLNAKNPLYHCGKVMTLDKILPAKLENFIAGQFVSAKIKIAPALCAHMTQLCHGHIYFVQMLGFETWERARGHKQVTSQHIDQAITHILHSQQVYFSSLWDRLSAKQKNLILAILLQGHSKLQNIQLLNQYDLGSATGVSKNLKALESQEMLEKQGADYTFANPFFPLWLRREIV